jgi:hypothetical protein
VFPEVVASARRVLVMQRVAVELPEQVAVLHDGTPCAEQWHGVPTVQSIL